RFPGPTTQPSFPTRRSSDLEHAAVPEIVAGGDVAFGRGQVGLLHELFDRTHAFAGGRADVAVAGLRPGGHDAEGDQAAGPGSGQDRKSTRLNSSHVKISYAA